MNASRIKTPINPQIEIIVSIIDQVRNVSLKLRLKYSLQSQKPESLTCDNNRLPAPTASTIKLGLACVDASAGAMMPAAVNPATVADPMLTRMTAAINQPSSNGLMLR